VHATEQLNAALAGRYTIQRHIGEGGMAMVYLARDVRHQRNVALKVLKPDLGAVVGVDRFLSEIQVTANLQHPNLLPLFDSGAAEGLLFYVMPYVEGESLRARLHREKQLPVDEAVRLATAIANALDYAHRHGVIHRDLKPENILLHEDQPLVADFGIALAVSNAGGNRITQTGLSLGTPQYMSPEQATGDRVIDGRTDIYSLGALTYEMLTGEPPHTGNTSQQVIARVLTEKPRSIRASRPSVPEHVEGAVERALEKLPADRWATAKEYCEALTGTRPTMRPTSAHSRAPRAESRKPRLRELAAWVVAVAALAALAVSAMRNSRASRQPVLATEFQLTLPDSLDPTPRQSASSLAISADGSTIVFQASDHQDAAALYVRRLDDRLVQKIRGSDSARAPALSPDGSELVYASLNASPGMGLKRLPLRGGMPRTIAVGAATNGQLSWLPDNRVLYAGDNALYIASVDGGAGTLLVKPDTVRGHRRYGFPDVLPGGKAAVITVWRQTTVLDSTVIGIVTIPEGRVTEIGMRGTYGRYSGTGHILAVAPDAWLMAVPFDVGSLERTGEPFPVVEGVRVGAGGAASFSVARNGTLVYLPGDAVSGARSLLMVDRQGKARELPIRKGFYSYPRVSPDGRQIALSVSTGGGVQATNPDIWRYDTLSRTLARVTTDSQSVRSSWLNDEQVAFLRPAGPAVYTRPLYNTGVTRPLLTGPNGIADFTNAGKYGAIRVANGTNGTNDIWLVHMDSLDAARPFLAEAYNEQGPAISPDGTLLAYTTNRTGGLEVYVRPVLGGGPELQVSVAGGIEPVWSRSGRELFYRSPSEMMVATVVSRPRLAVTNRVALFQDRNFFSRNPVATNYDVFPGGQQFVMISTQTREQAATALPIVVKMSWHLRPKAAP
jgi:serine/threonine protein kinase/Tol biopolymer transport system component